MSENKSYHDGFMDGYAKGIDDSRRWISIDDKMPEEEITVLVKSDSEDNDMSTAVLKDGEFEIDYERFNHNNGVAFWRPL